MEYLFIDATWYAFGGKCEVLIVTFSAEGEGGDRMARD